MKKTSIVVIGIIIIAGMTLLTGLFINQTPSKGESTGSINGYNKDSWEEQPSQNSAEPQEIVKGIVISGDGTEKKISHPGETIDITISGSNHNITVNKDTKIDNIVLSGIDNVVRVSRDHSFTSVVSGVDTEIVYYD